jgi:hypothetical protein
VNKITEGIPSTVKKPDVTPQGIVTSNSVADTNRIFADGIVIAPNNTVDVGVNPVPVIVTIVPACPEVGETPLTDNIPKFKTSLEEEIFL